MKKKIISIEFITITITLLFLFVISILYIEKENKKKAKMELNTYVNIAREIFNGNNFEEVNQILAKSNSDIRLTIISNTGNVIIDTSLEVAENHLDREEIQNLGECVIRYSSSLKKKMMYLVTLDEGYYLRVSIPLASVESFVHHYIGFGLFMLVIILFITIIIITLLFDKELKPIQKEINKLEEALGDNPSNKTNLEHLSHKINELTLTLEEKVNSLTLEKEKSKFILDNMNQGLILLDNSGKIKLVNQYALTIFKFEHNYLMNKHYLYLFRDVHIQEKIEDCLTKKNESQEMLILNGKKYLVYVSLFNDKIQNRDNTSVALFIIDITLQENMKDLKKDFFANTSHELKSPLTSIIGYQQLIQQGILQTKEEIQDATKRTIKEAQRMNKLIIEMLDLSRLEHNVQTILEEVEISKVIKDSLSELEVLASHRKITIHTTLDSFVITSNPNDVYKLIKNIIENAIIYNKENGKIDISIDKNNYRIMIRDTGIGISPEDLNHIFDRFYRVDKNRSKESSGTGLGLSIVKHICILYGYKIDINSKIGEGTIVTIDFK